MISERGERLRAMGLEDLRQAANAPSESITVESRPATISLIVQPKPNGSVRVVIQGFMKARFIGKHVALDGFYKYPDGSVPMHDEEFYEFD